MRKTSFFSFLTIHLALGINSAIPAAIPESPDGGDVSLNTRNLRGDRLLGLGNSEDKLLSPDHVITDAANGFDGIRNKEEDRSLLLAASTVDDQSMYPYYAWVIFERAEGALAPTLQEMVKDPFQTKHHHMECGGVVISPKIVITSARCKDIGGEPVMVRVGGVKKSDFYANGNQDPRFYKAKFGSEMHEINKRITPLPEPYDGDGDMYEVESYAVHPRHKYNHWDYDIMVIVLEGIWGRQDEYNTVKLNYERNVPKIGDRGDMVGHGQTLVRARSVWLRHGPVEVASPQYCSTLVEQLAQNAKTQAQVYLKQGNKDAFDALTLWSTMQYNDDRQICAGGSVNLEVVYDKVKQAVTGIKGAEGTTVRACDGDFGGPLLSERDGEVYLDGIISYNFRQPGARCWDPKKQNTATMPTVITRISAHHEWIRNTVCNKLAGYSNTYVHRPKWCECSETGPGCSWDGTYDDYTEAEVNAIRMEWTRQDWEKWIEELHKISHPDTWEQMDHTMEGNMGLIPRGAYNSIVRNGN